MIGIEIKFQELFESRFGSCVQTGADRRICLKVLRCRACHNDIFNAQGFHRFQNETAKSNIAVDDFLDIGRLVVIDEMRGQMNDDIRSKLADLMQKFRIARDAAQILSGGPLF